jgi:hypothetical protein
MCYAHAILLFNLWGCGTWCAQHLCSFCQCWFTTRMWFVEVTKRFKRQINWKLQLCCLCHTLFFVLMKSRLWEKRVITFGHCCINSVDFGWNSWKLWLCIVHSYAGLCFCEWLLFCALCSSVLVCVLVNGVCQWTVSPTQDCVYLCDLVFNLSDC